MALSVHKLTAGSGYTYLTRQVATQDATERGHSSLASYYTEKGESPGRWVGSGLAGLGGINEGDAVSEAHMLNLFGAGYHPLAEQLRAAAADAGEDARTQERVGWLGTPFRVYAEDVTSFRVEVARRVADLNITRGLDASAPVSVEDRARIRTEVAVERFRQEFKRDPADARELSATIARLSRPRTTAVAGYDLTFSPVKSVSTLWAVADRSVAAAIELAHDAAVADALGFLERTALLTRQGHDGVRQVETRGLVAVAFTHRDSRAGDPDLHTHVAVANKVQARADGTWLAVDGRPLYKAITAASEVYTTALQAHLRETLGVRFVEVPNRDESKRPTREIEGVDPALAARWSTRRADITARTGALAKAFQADHGRPPTPVEAIKLAQQATLETRDAKHPARSLAEQRDTWAGQAREVLGSDHAVRAMVAAALSPDRQPAPGVDAAWIRDTAARIGHTLASHRAVWQQVHVYAEAQRQVRHTDLPLRDQLRVAALLVDEVLTHHSVVLARPGLDPITDLPEELRRSDGSSVYTPAGSTLYTSIGILEAEARIVARAGQHDGARAPETAVQVALTAAAQDGIPLNAGQATLVREMATSGARVQLAIAPAGAGKTTAMRALTHAWTSAGGTVLGLAPSAAAAHVLGESIETTSDTLAKLAWHLQHPALGETPAWVTDIGPQSLVLIDEAGMADTLTLDTVIEHVTAKGGSVRLIGDDQQLAAIGAGGVLRDIHTTHGSLHLSELMRFTDPAEGAASLALRDGAVEAIGFYLDHRRVHVGDLTTLCDDLFTAWAADQAAGVDAVMLAPTRDLVADLNTRARAHRLTTTGHGVAVGPVVTLSDGLSASVGDTVITRANDRRLPTGATEFVKNGDRWTVTGITDGGALTVSHIRHRRSVTLPAEYVRTSVELGYASTIHTAQGVTAGRSHTLLTGAESRQLLYTAVTRGRDGNHLYLDVVGAADEHALIRPETTHPRTATDILEEVLARDESARSATTTAREHTDPRVLLGEAVAQYRDALQHAAEAHLGEANIARLVAGAEILVPGLTDAPAWPTLRAHLILAAAHGHHPLHELQDAVTHRGLATAHDPAAVLDWRLPRLTVDPATGIPGPLPWLPGIPAPLLQHRQLGQHLAARAAHVRARAAILTDHATNPATDTPAWARQGHARPESDLLAQVEVWRAATGVDPTDRRPTGPAQQQPLIRTYQDRLNRRLAAGSSPALDEWAPLLEEVLPGHHTDPFTPVLAERLAAVSRAGLDTPALLAEALSRGALPDDHAAAALWWRFSARLSPAVAATTSHALRIASTWTQQLPDLLGADTTAELTGSPWWGALVTVVDHALARGHTLSGLLAQVPGREQDLDRCQGLVWRLTSLTTPPPDHDDQGIHLHGDDSDPQLEEVPWAPTDAEVAALEPLNEPAIEETPDAPDDPAQLSALPDPEQVEAAISLAALLRQDAGPLPPSEAMIQAQVARAIEADTSPVPPERIAELNTMAADYYSRAFTGSWAQTYLAERLAGTDLTSHREVRPGYAPAGWTRLVDHLGGHGATDEELLAAGLASLTRDGRLIDRFRDRLILPITTAATAPESREPVVLGFVARRHPEQTVATGGPKYLNTPDTVLFHKGAQLYTAGANALLTGGGVPVLVEGPLDALAITTATQGRYVGLAPLGTAFTDEQAHHFASLANPTGAAPVVAADADTAGRQASVRAYWLLTQHGLTPTAVQWQPGSDPADTLTRHGRQAVCGALEASSPLSQRLLDDSPTQHHTAMDTIRARVAIVAAGSPDLWDRGTQQIADSTKLPLPAVRRELATTLQDRARDPRAVTEQQLRPRPARRETTPAPQRGSEHRVMPEPAPALPPTPRGIGPSR